jgi:hydroxypyruvate isomerase
MVRLAANLSFFFKELPLLQRFGAAARAGFRHTEFMFAGDAGYEVEASAVRAELDAHGLTHELLNAPAGDWLAGERGLAGLPGRERDFKASIELGLRFAGEIGCRKMHVMAGLCGSGDSGDNGGAMAETFVERLQWASGLAADAGVTLCVEPLNARDFPGYLVPDVPTALELLRRVDSPEHCKLQLDLYHVAMSALARGQPVPGSAELQSAIREYLPHSAHVQIANPPGRNEPGVGDVDYPPLLALLDELGYAGAVGCEYRPSTPATEDSLGWAKEHLRR